jgi:hypothetical protein
MGSDVVVEKMGSIVAVIGGEQENIAAQWSIVARGAGL